MDTPANGSNEVFLAQLRQALQHLYDPTELRHNPLQNLLPFEPGADRVFALRKILQDTIQALKPGDDIPAGSNAWRVYDVLAFRFIEQSSQKEVAADMSLSIRQLQRLETNALEVLGDHLVSRYNLSLLPPSLPSSAAALPGAPSGREVGSTGFGSADLGSADLGNADMVLEHEFSWLKKSSQNKEIETALLVEATVTTLAPLIQAMGAHFQVNIPSSIPKVNGQLTILRQALINLLTVALRIGKNGRVDLAAAPKMGKVQIRITSIPASDGEILDTAELLSVTHQLVELSQGVLEIQYQDSRGDFEAILTLPAVQSVTVLVIDDNQDTLLLLERYLAGSRYQFAGGRDPAQMSALIEQHHPAILVLDVMLPGSDGWELLGRLKGNADTCQIPVIISTILPQKSLALMLGAADFLRKPFTQAQLLEALERQTNQPIPESS